MGNENDRSDIELSGVHANSAKPPLTRKIVQVAIDGDRDAIDAVLDYYAETIDSVCVRTSKKRDGTIVKHIDEDMRNQIRHMFIRDLPNCINMICHLNEKAKLG